MGDRLGGNPVSPPPPCHSCFPRRGCLRPPMSASQPPPTFPQARAQGVTLSGRSHAEEGGAPPGTKLITCNWQDCGGRGPQALPPSLPPFLGSG